MERISRISSACADIVRHYEGLNTSAYLCPAGVWTIGIGTTRYPDGSRVQKGHKISIAQAYQFFAHDVRGVEQQVDDLTRDTLSQQQFDALVSIVYNIGAGEDGFKSSTLRKMANIGAGAESITKSFAMWNKARVKGKLKPLPGLTARRQTEAVLYNTGIIKYFN